MKLTVFNSQKTTGKYPKSPYNDDTFNFETRSIHSISEVFDSIASNFTLNIPIKKNIKTFRRKDNLKELFVSKLDYIIVDIDDITKKSDRALAIQFFRDNDYSCVLGESRTDYRIKGVLACEKMTQKEAKEVLKEIQTHIPGVVDMSSLNYASYQAPILKHKILYEGGTTKYPIPNIKVTVPQKAQVTNNIQQLCINQFNRLGFSFDTLTEQGYKCSHPSEVKSKGGFSWSREHPFTMSHWNQARNVSIWKEIIQTKEYRDFQNQKSINEVKDIIPNSCGNVNERYLGAHTEKVLEFLETSDMLKIQSPMGTGKSRIIEEVIHQSRKKGLKVLFLTNRISLADDISAKYNNIKHYLGTETEENNYTRGDDLVVQIDSLHKYSIKFFDVVILDEAATTLTHLLTLEKHQKKISKQMFSLKDRKLVLADAFVFDEMVQIFEPKSIVEITNDYRDDVDITMFTQKDNFIFNLIEDSRKQPITFSSGSTQMLKIVKLLLDQNGISNLTISSETPKTLKQAIFKSFSSKQPKAQVIMYSPSLTVGVSNENNIKVHYHYDAGLSMDVLSSIQMTKRTRSVEEIKICLSERIKYNVTSSFLIQAHLSDFMEQDNDGDDCGISEAGTKFAEIQSLYNKLENRHKVSFLYLMALQFDIKNVTKVNQKVQPFVDKYSKIVKENIKNEKLDIFEMYKLMSDEKISDIELQLFATSKKELYVREFELIKNDTTIKLNNEDKDMLIKAEIESPGLIEKYKKNLLNPDIILLSNNYTYTKAQANKLLSSGIDIKEYGFVKSRVWWKLHSTLQKLKETND